MEISRTNDSKPKVKEIDGAVELKCLLKLQKWSSKKFLPYTNSGPCKCAHGGTRTPTDYSTRS